MRRSLLYVAVLVLADAGCRSPDNTAADTSTLPAPTESRMLVEDLRLGVDEPFLGHVADIDVAADGSIYVSAISVIGPHPDGFFAYETKFSPPGTPDDERELLDNIRMLGSDGMPAQRFVLWRHLRS